MRACPYCNASLSDKELKQHACQNCGRGFEVRDGKPVERENAGGGTSETLDSAELSDSSVIGSQGEIALTLDSDSVSDDVVQQIRDETVDSAEIFDSSLEELPKDDIDATLDSGTVSDEVIKKLSQQQPQPPSKTVTDSDVTLDSGTVNDDVIKKLSAEGVVSGSDADPDATLDSGSVSDEALEKLSQETLDSNEFDEQPKKASTSSKTIPDNATLADAEITALSGDSEELDEVKGGESPTLQPRRLDPTVDSSVFEESVGSDEMGVMDDPDINGTIDITHTQKTIASDSFEVMPAPGDKTVGDVFGQTIEGTAADLQIPGEDHIINTWEGTVREGNPTIQTSLKLDEEFEDEDDITQSRLVIQTRLFATDITAAPREFEYEIVKLLGEGGMGSVFAARQASIDRTVAIKMLKAGKDEDERQKNKFLAEAAVTGELEHPNIVPIYDLGKNSKGALFYAMKRVQGTPWDEKIDELEVHENLSILMRVCDAIAFAHDKNVIHRDLKPENIMLGDFGEVLVMDWGLAVPLGKRTVGGMKLKASMGGTPAYMAPEMASGPFDRVGKASDVYLMGAILFEIITGRPPHSGKNVMQCLMAAAKNKIIPTEKSGELLDIAYKALSSQPRHRYRSIKEFQEAVRSYISHSESISLSSRAIDDLATAHESDDYKDYSRALFGFQEAFQLWEGNRRAEQGIVETNLAYANSAKNKGDLDLAASLLDSDVEAYSQLLNEIAADKREREARVHRLRRTKQLAGGLAATMFVVITVALVFVMNAKRAADIAKIEAETQRDIAEEEQLWATLSKVNAERAKEQETRERERADRLRIEAELARVQAEDAQLEATFSQHDAELSRDEADEQRVIAEREREEADIARDRAEEEQLWATLSKINAERAKEQETKERERADRLRIEAELARVQAEDAQLEATFSQHDAELSRDEADEQRVIAEREREEADDARVAAVKQREIAEYQAYVARIGAAAARIEDNAFESAMELLEACVPVAEDERDYRNWEWRRLWHLANQSSSEVDSKIRLNSVAVSPNGEFVVASGWSPDAQVWSSTTHEKLYDLPAGLTRVACVDVYVDEASNRTLIATAGDDPRGFVKIWDFNTGALVETMPHADANGHTRPVTSVEFSNDGKRILTGSEDRTAKLWDRESGEIKTFAEHRREVWSVSFSPDNKHFVSTSDDGSALVWDIESGIPSEPFRGHNGPVYSAAYSPDGTHIASGGLDGFVLVWKSDPKSIKEFDYQQAIKQFREIGTSQIKEDIDFQILVGHTAAVRNIRFGGSIERPIVVSAGHDNTIRVWNSETGEAIKTLRGHGQWVRSCDLTEDGTWIASGGFDEKVKLWELNAYQEVRVLQSISLAGHMDSVLSANFSPLGNEVVTAGQDRTAMVWPLDSDQGPTTLRDGHDFLASRVVVFPDGIRMATAAYDNSVRIWNLQTGIEMQVLTVRGRSAALAISSDGSMLMTGGEGSLRTDDSGESKNYYGPLLWDPADGTIIQEFADSHRSPISFVAFSDDDKLAVAGDNNGRLVIYDVATGEVFKRLKNWHVNAITGIAFIDDGNGLVSASRDNTVAVWDLTTDANPRSLKFGSAVTSIVVTGDQQAVIGASADGTVTMIDLVSGEPIRTFVDPGLAGTTENSDTMGSGKNSQLALSPDGTRLASLNSDLSRVRMWDTATGEQVMFTEGGSQSGPCIQLPPNSLLLALSFTPDSNSIVTVGGEKGQLWSVDPLLAQSQRLRMNFQPHGVIASARFSPVVGEHLVVTSSWDKTARVWNAETGKVELKLENGHESRVNCALFTPDGKEILSVGEDGAAILWDARQGQIIRRLERDADDVSALMWATITSDGKFAVGGTSNGQAIIWNLASGKMLRRFQPHEQAILSITIFSDDEQTVVATAGDDNRVVVWDFETGEVIQTLSGHAGAVRSVAFSADGKRLVSGSDDFVAKVWDWREGNEILSLKGHNREITSVEFSKDGRYVLTASNDGTAIVWIAAKPAVTSPKALAVVE